MATNFPTSLDALTNPTPTDALNSATVPHSAQHANANDAIEALQAKVGVDSSAVATSLDYRVGQLESNPPSASWGGITGTLGNQTDLAGALSGKEDTGTAAAAVSAHEGAADPHPDYLKQADTDALYAGTAHGHDISDVSGLQTALDGKTSMTGFPVDSSGNYLCTLSYNETTRTVTLAPTGSDFIVFCGGVPYTKGSASIAHDDVQGGHFIYYDAGTLTYSTTPWDILRHAMVAYVFWDATNNRGICLDERHHAGRDLWWHRNQHTAEGTKATSGFAATGYTLSDGSTDAAVTYAIASGVVEDEDIKVTTAALPDAGPYTLLYRSGAAGDWVIDRTPVRPFLDSGTALQYNQSTGATWQLTALTEDYYVNYWVMASTAIPVANMTPSPTTTQQIIIVPGQAIYSTEAAAHAESVGNLSWGTIPLSEVVPLYQVTMRYNASNPSAYANTAKCAITRLARVIGTSATISQTAQTDHGGLSGLTDDDHSQYTLTTTGSTRAEINLGASPTDTYALVWDAATEKIILGRRQPYAGANITVSATEPVDPATNDIWIDIS